MPFENTGNRSRVRLKKGATTEGTEDTEEKRTVGNSSRTLEPDYWGVLRLRRDEASPKRIRQSEAQFPSDQNTYCMSFS